MEVSRYVNLAYALFFMVCIVTFYKAVDAIWERFELPNFQIAGDQLTLVTLVAVAVSAALTFYCYKIREDYLAYVTEVVLELKKVTWPTWEETKRATLVVIIFTIVVSGFIFLADQFWNYATDLLLMPGA